MLLDWIADPDPGAGLHEYDEDGWASHPYPWLAARTRGVSAQLREAGIRRGDVVAIAGGDCVDFAAALFGTLHAGATPLPLSPAPVSARAEGDRTAVEILRSVSPAVIAAAAAERARALDLRMSAAIDGHVVELLPEQVEDLPPAPAAELALLQFTSGSTGTPRGVRVSFENLAANVAMCRDWFGWRTHRGGASWLPLQHDMGLIGMLMVAICVQRDLWQMKPVEFLVEPLRWLECLGGGGATITAAPTFGYSYVTRRVDADRLEGLDFGDWRTAVVGAERVIPQVLADFAELLGPRGFRPEALRPAYGMAEATLAITGDRGDRAPQMVAVPLEQATIGEEQSLGEPHPVTAGEATDADAGLVVSCGEPLPGLAVRVVGENGTSLPDGALGEIAVRGPSVARGYHADRDRVSTRFEGDELLTGDAGFLLDGELYVLGRIADSIKVRGTYVYAEDLEIATATALGLPLSRCVVVTVNDARGDRVAVLIETDVADLELDGLVPPLRSALGQAVELRIYFVPRRSLLRTTSGKPRRRRIRELLSAEELEAELALTVPAGEPVAA